MMRTATSTSLERNLSYCNILELYSNIEGNMRRTQPRIRGMQPQARILKQTARRGGHSPTSVRRIEARLVLLDHILAIISHLNSRLCECACSACEEQLGTCNMVPSDRAASPTGTLQCNWADIVRETSLCSSNSCQPTNLNYRHGIECSRQRQWSQLVALNSAQHSLQKEQSIPSDGHDTPYCSLHLILSFSPQILNLGAPVSLIAPSIR